MKSIMNIKKARGFITSCLMICLIGLFPSFAIAQDKISVSGTVTDKDGEALIGVSVVVKGDEANGVMTDIDGSYIINAAPTAVLKFSYVGYQTMEEKVQNRTTINIRMEENTNQLEEVVVVGYGTMEKRAITTSVSSIKGDNLTTGLGGATIATALQGKIPGLTISGTSSPNSSNGFQLRGVASVNASSGPLVVIDGIPGGDMRSLNQEDIESIDVLKDASAGAIYGTRAAGGVILITTKQAKTGGVKLRYTGEVSMETIRKRPEVLSASQYIERGVGADYGGDTDWYNELTRDNPISNRHVINISGGSENALIYTTFTTQDQKGIVIGDARRDFSGRINTTFKLLEGKVEIKTNTEYRQTKRDQRNSSSTFNMALALNPTIPVYDASTPSGYNIKNGFGTDYNPVADIMLKSYDGKDRWLLTDATMKIKLTDELSATGTIGYQEADWQLTTYRSAQHKESESGQRGSAYHGYDKNRRTSVDAYLTYDKTFAEVHRLNAVGGYSFWEYNRSYFNMTNGDFPIDGVGAWDMSSGMDLTNGNGKAAMNSYKAPRERLMAFFGRVNYTFNEKYMLTASIRHEGSSKFGKNNRWGDFWAISGGWRVSDEKFIKENFDFVSEFKVRLGYGVTGNNGFGTGYTTRMYTSNQMWPTNGIWNPGYGSKRNVNPDLKWEEKSELNFGFDYAFFNNRLYGKFDIYNRKVDDMLYEVNAPMPPMTHTTIMKNVGSLQNRGWEFEIGGDIIKTKDFSYSTTMRFSQNTSKIKDMGDAGYYLDEVAFPSPGNPGKAVRLTNGTEIGKFFIFKYAGLDENGKFLIYDKDNNVVPANDKTLIAANKRHMGNAMPKLIASWDHNFSYRNFDMSVSLRSWIDYDVFSQVNMYYGIENGSQTNVLKKAFGYYSAIDDEKVLCDLWLSDGTFLKIDAINLGYTLNAKKYTKYMDKARFYLTMRDVAMFTKYKGVNPEVNLNGLTPGFEYIKDKDTMYPQTIRFTLGVQLTF
ncbi:SusC/RagA family TonB-linked outer membrane protein [Dysgonomonas sp. 25]|uniref:SusC/RagA family TonB-linked outer membrane protein n=1 Tax=Dysgonomonas sp. 25 TaxID=2302933 RepID=UPI0013D5E09C|nr:SusC/RagA family TonB-linked outer membrane protein [Dysgonomonas sp. 25]NDV70139.1 SusC/RagA family TonB-linked outer membrane protein [Dysgonomonas sp. 25]